MKGTSRNMLRKESTTARSGVCRLSANSLNCRCLHAGDRGQVAWLHGACC